ncbi:hypothetical protein RHECIAT_CH0003086 [Rhizobium etli CIAT 652]|uniref:Transmembrane protein n=1 Tax=Rhizobium etli (strain CIAT 652) TaxID=491916 RepID=B3PUF3_RHIE6|nr:hypothetical protein RHECIAT_CH0003086 [Rhizobium etli CIAT 652]
MKFKLKKRHTFAIGMLFGLLVFAIGREVCWAFAAQPWGLAISGALTTVGSLKWIDTTLVTGSIAAVVAFFSLGAVGRQILQAERMENDRFLAKRASAQAILPLTLSDITAYAQDMAVNLDLTLDQCVNGVLPRPANLPDFPTPPERAINELARMVEHSFASERLFVSRLLSVIQVVRSRVDGMVIGNAGDELTLDMNIHSMMIDCAEIHARTSALYNFGRNIDAKMPSTIKTSDVTRALLQLSLEDSLPAERIEAYGLNENRVFERWGVAEG